MRMLLAIAGVAAVTLAAPAMAHDEMKNGGATPKSEMMNHYFNKIDTNGDGYITKEEQQTFGDRMFQEADANHDGKLSMEEMHDAKKKEKAEMSETENPTNKGMKPAAAQ